MNIWKRLTTKFRRGNRGSDRRSDQKMKGGRVAPTVQRNFGDDDPCSWTKTHSSDSASIEQVVNSRNPSLPTLEEDNLPDSHKIRPCGNETTGPVQDGLFRPKSGLGRSERDNVGTFTIERRVHKTCYGAAFEAKRFRDNKKVLLKISSIREARELSKRRKMVFEDPERELRILVALSKSEKKEANHSGYKYIVRLEDAFISNDQVAIALEWCDQGELLEYIPAGVGLPRESVRVLGQQIGRALLCLHLNGFAHLDLSLENIMLVKAKRQGECPVEARIIDFGGGGKIGYMPPERYAGKPFDEQLADAWAWAMCVLSMASGLSGIDRRRDRPCLSCPMFRKLTSGSKVLHEVWGIENDLSRCLARIFRREEAKRWSIAQALDHYFFDKDPFESVWHIL